MAIGDIFKGEKRPVSYFIPAWWTTFEKAQSRRARTLSYICTPNKHDGKGYRRLIRHPSNQNCELFGAWNLIAQVASKCPVRGILEDADGPLTATDLSDKTGYPVGLFATALKVLSEPEIAWLQELTPAVRADYEAKQSGVGAESEAAPGQLGAQCAKGREGKERERKGESARGRATPGAARIVQMDCLRKAKEREAKRILNKYRVDLPENRAKYPSAWDKYKALQEGIKALNSGLAGIGGIA